MSRIIRLLLPIAILAACGWYGWWLIANKPELKAMETRPVLITVEGMTLKKQTYPVRVASQGAVQPRTRSTLLPEVAGMIVEVSPSFRPGGFFEKDEVLVKLDPVDYETAVTVARAAVALAKVTLVEEQAKSEQALENWKALGRKGSPGELVSRSPQVARAKADLAAAEARVVKAERDAQRTIIRAPYAGQVLEQAVDVGQYVSQGTVLGRIFATDFVEVRLPLPERESRFVNLPERYRDGATTVPPAKVKLQTTTAGKKVTWEGRLVRVESALDQETRQTTAVAQIDDPFSKRADGAPPLKIGQFVEAEIEGEALDDVFVIPRSVARAGNEIILITKQNTLKRMFVEPIVGTDKHLVISASTAKGLKEGDVLCLTPIPFPADGARVTPVIDGRSPDQKVAGDATPEKKSAMLTPAAKPLP
ncbi:efflux RND transporter periplasmic adaptor subunit [Prosthecobacter sp.]|uniref:efflux RND transporter periplasmic adaptor subunit n=1 Tax=Prosthecobacter sp. TaxID=1965333 RepID=UPI001D27AFF6|nr:efflux RND transporter periplasmic adaptor subunit [Prosthecobacter sp.]MCB1279830.1 efflux RND transporter periplasmic adaptor subunit [Prosthecobacter sp.]